MSTPSESQPEKLPRFYLFELRHRRHGGWSWPLGWGARCCRRMLQRYNRLDRGADEPESRWVRSLTSGNRCFGLIAANDTQAIERRLERLRLDYKMVADMRALVGMLQDA